MAQARRTILALIAATSLASAFIGIGTIGAAADGVHFQYLAGSGVLCGLGPTACPDVASASNGDTVAISGQGSLVTGPDEVTGSGTFVHMNAAGTVLGSGTWTAEDLLSFTSFGGNAPGLPPNFEGGLARIEVQLNPSGSGDTLNAVLQIDCGINSATGAEGVMLAVEDGPNFNNEVSGFTVFIRNGSED